MHQTELFGPLLAVMRADNLDHAIEIANDTAYGLTSGLQSLDEREQKKWIEKIQAGNCYINRSITGAIVRRQPFGGTKNSSFGPGAKAGGPNYVMQFAHPIQKAIPKEKHSLNEQVNHLTALLQKIPLDKEELGIWYASISSYAYWAKHFAEDHDPSQLVGQDNILRYQPHKQIALRIQENDAPLDVLRVLAAAMSCHAKLEISLSPHHPLHFIVDYLRAQKMDYPCVEESAETFNKRVENAAYKRIRLVSLASEGLKKAAAQAGCYLIQTPVLINGRFELLHFLREISLSIDYHRYGNLHTREAEQRKPLS